MKKQDKTETISDTDLVLDMSRIYNVIPNKYEFIIVVSKLAHIIARKAMEEGTYLKRKPYLIAAEAVLKKEVPYDKGVPKPVAEEGLKPSRRKGRS
ncbi:MAG: hypothetical protein ABIM46_04465 [candidate division WOR-3 bacterium]